MKWIKKGKIFDPSEKHPHDWMYEYALAPSTLIKNDSVRVFFSCRPKRNVDGSVISYSAYVDLDPNNLFNVKAIADSPIVNLGPLGAFDEFGVVVTSIVQTSQFVFAYYIGWSRMQSVPYATAIGVLKSQDGGNTFQRIGKGGPIISSNNSEPYREQASPIVRIFNNKWHMWYMTGIRWIEDKKINRIEPIYRIVHATSDDGIDWKRDGKTIISPLSEDECQTTPNVFYHQNKFHMFFSYRRGLDFRSNKTRSYRIGYASSDDLLHWKRNDDLAGIAVSDNGWDSEMICYPHVFELNNKFIMLYCGNEFGRHGFGFAELDI